MISPGSSGHLTTVFKPVPGGKCEGGEGAVTPIFSHEDGHPWGPRSPPAQSGTARPSPLSAEHREGRAALVPGVREEQVKHVCFSCAHLHHASTEQQAEVLSFPSQLSLLCQGQQHRHPRQVLGCPNTHAGTGALMLSTGFPGSQGCGQSSLPR